MRKFTLQTAAARERVAAALRALDGWAERPEQSCTYRLDFQDSHQRAVVKQYTNGTLLIQPASGGDGLAERLGGIVEAAAPGMAAAGEKPKGTHYAPRGTSVGVDVERPFEGPWIGTDEAGKGDYFGPLVACAVYVDERLLGLLATIGVRDSKRLSDTQNRKLAGEVRLVCGDRCAEVVVPPERYNALYDQMKAEGKNLNSLLAWGHTRAIETLLERVPCENVIVDQFADARYIQTRLLGRGSKRTLNVVQMPKAEANVAVAAASVLARDRFLGWIERTSRELGIELPKGASSQVEVVAKRILQEHGAETLRRLVKLHFKTTERVVVARYA